MSDFESDFNPGSEGDLKAKKTVKAPKKPTVKKTAAEPRVKAAPKKKPTKIVSDDDAMDLDSDDPSPPKKTAGKKRVSGAYTDDRAIEEIYQKKTQLEHILLRPDTYIGSVEATQQNLWVYESPTSFAYRPVTIVPGLYKIVDEILVNAADNKVRDPTMDTIKVVIDVENNLISVYNNGRGIPVEIHKEEGVYVPELIFGHLLTSSNYNDGQKKVTGGRNGYGAKLCNIFSTEFTVETADRTSGKKYKQVFSHNMSEKKAPVITSNARNEEYTRISFKPDLEKFGMTAIDADLEALLKKRVYDMAGVVKNIKVYLNDERIGIRSFKQYVDMYMNSKSTTEDGSPATQTVYFEAPHERWEVGFALSDGQFQQVSFVNSICTSKGGTHANYVADQLVTKLMETIKKKNKAAPVKPFQIKNHMWIFVNCQIENPTFDSQTKDTLTLKTSAFGSKFDLSDDYIKKVLKSGVVENVLNYAKFKQDQQLKKTDGTRRSRLTGIVKLEDANNAGTSKGKNCTLILTEGDSAKALAVSGLSVVGRDNFGVFPLRGKMLNVRDATHPQIMNNVEISYIKQILGLQHGKAYSSIETLRYGHLMIMTDQDHDGSHIKGLLINFLDHFFPSLLRLPGFLLEFITPIVKVTKGKQAIAFYTIPEYEEWKAENGEGKGWTIKYYKGLGTSTKEDARKYFAAMDRHMKKFTAITEEERKLIDLAFNKKKADDRKEWLRQFKIGTYIDHSVDEITYTDFINKELILFSMADNVRSIPSMVDGFKPGQRKVLFGCFKRKLKAELKVAQLAGYVAEHSAYHHGEQSLTSTIVGLAQDFVGNNNINLLEPRGQFGTRLQGGKDAASARYIFTTLSPITRCIFPLPDDNLLNFLNEEGDLIEPEWYVPVLPMVLVNGSDGIGTGWSSSIPNYNPLDIVANLRRLMNDEPMADMTPWYRGFNGVIEKISEDRFKVAGVIRAVNGTTIEITELPIRMWTQSYKEQLEGWCTGTDKAPAFVREYKEYHTDSTVHFVITLSEEEMRKSLEEGLEKRFKTSTTIATSNMVCFDKEGRIKKYTKAEEILQEFYPIRLEFYAKRKEMLINQYNLEWTKADNRVRFVMEIIQRTLIVSNRKRLDIVADLKRKDYTPFYKTKTEKDDEEEEERSASDHGYDYLLTMPIYNLTKEKVDQLELEKQEKEQQLKWITSQTAKSLWQLDLDQFTTTWQELLARQMEAEKKTVVKKGTKRYSMDEDDEDDYMVKKPKAVRKPKASPVKKPLVKTASPKTTLDTYFAPPAEVAIVKPKAVGRGKKVDAATDDAPIVKPKPAKKDPAVKKPPVKKVKRAIASDDEDDMSLDEAPIQVKPRAGRPVAKKKQYVELSDDAFE